MFTHRDTRAPEPMQALVYEELSLLHFFTIERLQPQEWPWQNHDSLARVSVKPGLWTLDSGLDSWTGLWTETWTRFWIDAQFNDHFQQ